MRVDRVIQKMESAPESAGVYIFKSGNEILYIGKARSLRKRLSYYVRVWNVGKASEKAYKIVEQADDLDYIVVNSEDEALILEANMIFQHKPRYNVSLKDSRFYPFIVVTEEMYPRVLITREHTIPGQYFGPYTDIGFVKDLLELVGKIFKVRQCSRSMKKVTRPCFEYHLKRCSAPCARLVDQKSYAEQVQNLVSFLKGEVEQIRTELIKMMENQSRALAFESAAKTRDVIAELDKLFPPKCVMLKEKKDVDAICYAGEFVLVLRVIKGILVSKLAFEATNDVILDEILEELYERRRYPQPEVVLVKEKEEVNSTVVPVRTPKNDEEGELLKLCELNLREEIKSKLLTVETLQTVRKTLGLTKLPHIVEGIDIAHTAGQDTVGAVVSFVDGKPQKNKYRIYKLSALKGDDFAAIREVMIRRYRKHPLPDLIFIDGGEPQIRVALESLRSLGLFADLVGIAKEEEVVVTLKKRLHLSPDHPVLRFLVQIRDEAHRFANTRHRRIKAKEDMVSLLDRIEGIGPKRKRMLLRHFGGITGLMKASEEEIAKLLRNSVLARRVKEIIGGEDR
ncbi:MAG: excinuclease ABC subunit C [Thermotogae bacterium]|nr:MAG: excinuclease ABC subunit C [Thermotogota bacterium]